MNLPALPSRYEMPPETIEGVIAVEECILKVPQVDLNTEHFLHGGMYCRTIRIPKGTLLTGAFIKLPTVLIISGNIQLWTGLGWVHLVGYHVIPSEKNRKQLGYSIEETHATMLFATEVKNVKDAEKQFTDDWARLMAAREV